MMNLSIHVIQNTKIMFDILKIWKTPDLEKLKFTQYKVMKLKLYVYEDSPYLHSQMDTTTKRPVVPKFLFFNWLDKFI